MSDNRNESVRMLRLAAAGVLAFTAIMGAAPPASQPASSSPAPESADFTKAKNALKDGRFKEARDGFLSIATAEPNNVAAMHGAAIAAMNLQNNQQAADLLARAIEASPAPNRTLSFNFAVADINLANYKRAAQTLRDYLYARPKDPDEPLLDALGAALQQTAEKNAVARDSDPTRKFFSVYTAMLEQKRPGYRKWGPEWMPATEVDRREKSMTDAETAMALSKKEMADSYARMGQYKQELAASRQGHGARSTKDLSRLLNTEEKTYTAKKASFDQAAATVDALRPKYPQLLLPIGMDETIAPPLSPLPAATAEAAPVAPLTPNAESKAIAGTAQDSPPDSKPSKPQAISKSPSDDTLAAKSILGIPPDQLKQCTVDADGSISTNREVKLTFDGTQGHDFTVTGEVFFGGSDEAGGALFILREQDGMHRYEVTGGGVRAKRVLLEGKTVAKFANPVQLSTVRGQWVKFEFKVSAAEAAISFGSSSGTVRGPLSMDGQNGVLLRPGGKLRNIKVIAG